MADVCVSLRTYLLSKTAITDLIGQRIYTDALPQRATIPALTMTIISETLDHALDGLAGIVATRIQFEAFASTRLVSHSIADAVIASGIDKLKGVYSSIDIRSVMVDSGKRVYTDPDMSGGDIQRYVTDFDLMVYFLRS